MDAPEGECRDCDLPKLFKQLIAHVGEELPNSPDHEDWANLLSNNGSFPVESSDAVCPYCLLSLATGFRNIADHLTLWAQLKLEDCASFLKEPEPNGPV